MAAGGNTAGRRPRGGRPALKAGPARWLASFLGLAVGISAQRADAFATWTGDLTSYLGLWIAVVGAVGFVSPTLATAASTGALFLLASVAGYYIAYAIDLTAAPRLIVAVWGFAAVTGGPLVGVAGRAMREPRWCALAAGGLAGLLLGEAATLGAGTSHVAPLAFDLVASAVALGAGTRVVRDRRAGMFLAGAFVGGAAVYVVSLALLRIVL